MKHDRLPKRSETKNQEGCRKRGRPQLRLKDCVRRDLGKAEEGEKLREKGLTTGSNGENNESRQLISLTPRKAIQEEV